MAFFFDGELDFLSPHFRNGLQGPIFFPDGSTGTLTVPSVGLAWTVAPRLEVGYRLPDSAGEFALSYHFLVAEGRGTATDDGGDVFGVKSRLNVNVVDFDYATVRYAVGPRWDLKWRLGIRLADVYYDTTLQNDVFYERASTNFFGAGPHAGLDVERRLGFLNGLALYGRLDGAALVGRVQQHFLETFPDSNGNATTGSGNPSLTQTLPVLTLQAGLTYTPPELGFLHFAVGYQFEQWWNVGKVGDSRGDLTTNGVFLRGQLDF